MKKQPIGFSTGSIWRWMKSENRNELIDFIRPLDTEAVELTIGSEMELHSLQLSDKNIAWLRSLEHVSIHAPDLHSTFGRPDRLLRQLNVLENLASLIKASTVVIHIEDLPPAEILKTLRFPVSIENTGPGNYTSPDRISEVLRENPRFTLCLDLAHAALISEEEAGILISRFRNQISHIHLSGVSNNSDHQSLIGASESFYRSIIPSFNLNLPFLIEEDIREQGMKYLEQELTAAHTLLKLRNA